MEMQLPKTIRGYELHERIGDGGSEPCIAPTNQLSNAKLLSR